MVIGPRQPRAGRLHAATEDGVQLRYPWVHRYRRAGRGPALVLVHGIGDSSATWASVLPVLARNHMVIAPDLLGHDASDKPRADYSAVAYANGIRDLLGVLGIDRTTLIVHSLGGGVAMQFAYQYPEAGGGGGRRLRRSEARRPRTR